MPEIESTITEISNLIKEGKVTFLVGPGISHPPPSCLPKPQEIISENECLKSLRQVYSKLMSTQNVNIEKLLSEQDNIYRQIEKIAPEYVYLRRGKPLNFNQMQKLLGTEGESHK